MTPMTESKTRIYRIIQDALTAVLPYQAPVIKPDTDLVGDIDLDSLRVMDMVMEIEDQLDITIPTDLLAEVRTVDDLASCILKRLAERQG